MHEMKFFNLILETPDQAITRIDDIGGPHSHTNYPWGWAQCGNSPFKWYKQNTHEGGVHVPMIVHWPAGIGAEQRGTKRPQFVNVADIVPTIYELLGINAPTVFQGVEQLPVTGHSFAALLADPAQPATNTLQYFEMMGSRALVAELDGRLWKAVCKHAVGADYDTEPWELYDLTADASECHDLAANDPERLNELIDLWWQEADRHGVLPLDDRGLELFGARFRERSPHPPSRRYVYRPPMSPIPGQASAAIGGRNFDLTARVTRRVGDEGVLWATGTENSGISVFVQEDRLVVDYNAFDDRTVVVSDVAVPAGEVVLTARFRRGEGRTGWIEVAVDGAECGRGDIALFMRMISSVGSTIGYDHGSPVSPRYRAPFPFTGMLHEVVIEVAPARAAGAAEAEARAEMGRQ
jgi:arylsulfatase